MRNRIKTYDVIKYILDATGEIFPPRGVFNNCTVLPGFTDVHVHLREPGFSYKETIATGTMAAAAGGFAHVLTMPNLDPVPDSVENLKIQTEIARRDGIVDVHPLGSITKGEKGTLLSDIEELAPLVAGFSDDGVGVMDDGLMKEAMERVRESGSIIVAHCEDTNYPRESHQAEYKQLERDLKLADITGCPYHMCHVSTRESLDLIRDAKKSSLDLTCETAPHYLTLSQEDISDEGRYKMNPPIKEKADRDALIEALVDGTVDMIATDHAPHSTEEKSGGFSKSAYGIVGLETAFPVLYTNLVRKGILTLDKLVSLLTDCPNERFKIAADMNTFGLWDLETTYAIDSNSFRSKGRSTPFEGWRVQGRCLLTVNRGKIVYRDKILEETK